LSNITPAVAGVQPEGTIDRCHESSSSPATMDSTASRWSARKASSAWFSASSFRLLVLATFRGFLVVQQLDVLVLAPGVVSDLP